MDGQVKKDLLKNMDLKEYPPRFHYEVVDLTRSKKFFARPNILPYTLTLGEEKISRKLSIPSLTGKCSGAQVCIYYNIVLYYVLCSGCLPAKICFRMQIFYIRVCQVSQIALSMMCLCRHP